MGHARPWRRQQCRATPVGERITASSAGEHVDAILHHANKSVCVHIYTSMYVHVHVHVHVHVQVHVRCTCTSIHVYVYALFIQGAAPRSGQRRQSRGMSHILLEVLETLLQFRSAHVRPPKRSPKA